MQLGQSLLTNRAVPWRCCHGFVAAAPRSRVFGAFGLGAGTWTGGILSFRSSRRWKCGAVCSAAAEQRGLAGATGLIAGGHEEGRHTYAVMCLPSAWADAAGD